MPATSATTPGLVSAGYLHKSLNIWKSEAFQELLHGTLLTFTCLEDSEITKKRYSPRPFESVTKELEVHRAGPLLCIINSR